MDKVLDILYGFYIYDLEVFSQPWIYWTIIPAIVYLAFFVVKWTVLTLPVWFPIKILLDSIFKENNVDKNSVN